VFRRAALNPTFLAALTGVLAGAAAGVGGFTFFYAKGASYLTNSPKACANCHVMYEQFDGWVKGSHRAVAVCNDCHTPPGFLAKYFTKGMNGFFHSFAFTTGRFPEHIRITERNRRVTESACRHCHAAVVAVIEGSTGRGPANCLACHPGVGHMESAAFGSVPPGFRARADIPLSSEPAHQSSALLAHRRP
jgi:cytochrome c nitrite reductase small subunit